MCQYLSGYGLYDMFSCVKVSKSEVIPNGKVAETSYGPRPHFIQELSIKHYVHVDCLTYYSNENWRETPVCHYRALSLGGNGICLLDKGRRLLYSRPGP